MSDALAGKNVVLTGASRGLGREIARVLWRNGANLLLVARSTNTLRDLCAVLEANGHRGRQVHAFGADLAAASAAATIVDEAHRHWDRVDALINNAAILGPVGNAWENDWDAWQTTLRVNLLAPVDLCRVVVPWMIDSGGGKIVNLSGGGATAPRPYFSAYATAKAGLVRFSETLAEEVKALNVQVNCVAPGPMNTDMNQAVLEAGIEKVGTSEHERAVDLAQKGPGIPTQAAELCLFLASFASDGITGKLISAVWDPWRELPQHVDELSSSDIYALRRIVPRDRGQNWQ